MKLQSLNLAETQIEITEKTENLQTKPFWKRQFANEITDKQKVFDAAFGIVLPVVCFFFDPIVFKGGRPALLGTYKPFAYLLSYVSIMALLAFMLWGEKFKWLNGFLSGLFFVGASISLCVGIVLFPFSLIGLVILIGVLGFTPLFTAFVYGRNAVRAYKNAAPILGKSLLINSFILSAIFSLVLPYLFNVKIWKMLETMRNGDARTIRATAQKLKYAAPLANFDKLAGTYGNSEGNEEHKALLETHKQLTGDDLERKNYIVCNDS